MDAPGISITSPPGNAKEEGPVIPDDGDKDSVIDTLDVPEHAKHTHNTWYVLYIDVYYVSIVYFLNVVCYLVVTPTPWINRSLAELYTFGDQTTILSSCE